MPGSVQSFVFAMFSNSASLTEACKAVAVEGMTLPGWLATPTRCGLARQTAVNRDGPARGGPNGCQARCAEVHRERIQKMRIMLQKRPVRLLKPPVVPSAAKNACPATCFTRVCVDVTPTACFVL